MNRTAKQACEAAQQRHQQGQIAEAEQFYREALRLDPSDHDAQHGLGVLCLQTRRLEAATAYLAQAAADEGRAAAVYNNYGVALSAAQRYPESADAFRRAIAADRSFIPAWPNLAAALIATDRVGDAVSILQDAIASIPEAAELHAALAFALTSAKRPGDAIEHLRRAVALEPKRAERHASLGSALVQQGDFDQAADCFREALTLSPGFVPAICGLGEALGGLDRHEEAAQWFERALSLAPNVALIHSNYGSALTYLGRMQEAAQAFEYAVALAPEVPSFRYAAMANRKTAPGDPHLAALERMAASAERYPAQERAELHLALAKAYDDLARYQEAFTHLQQGNAVKRALVAYDEEKELGLMRAIAAAFTPELLTANADAGAPSEAPVFIVGMPRSGSTLIEQILASHPTMFGANEQTILPDLVKAGFAGENFPATVASMRREDWRRLGDAYAEKLHALAPEATRVVDKLPMNILHVGLIRLALPKARIIHVTRDPLDTCFSCFTKLFGGHVNYTYDLGELGRYYRAYQDLMAHWRRVLPEGAILEVEYEQVVRNLEPEARRIVSYCGVRWDERCLSFHETKRVVRTASAFQVRRPLYQSSIGRAAPYAVWLEPLRAAMGDGAR